MRLTKQRMELSAFYLSWFVASVTVIDFANGTANSPFTQGVLLAVIFLNMVLSARDMKVRREKEIREYAEVRYMVLQEIERIEEEVRLIDENHPENDMETLSRRGWWLALRDCYVEILEEVDRQWQS